MFRLWPQGLPPNVDVAAVQLPGRATRLRERPISSIPAMVEAMLPELLPQLDLPFAFFGHSMGSMVAHALAQELARRGGPMPVHLFVSSRRPPRMQVPEPLLHPLSDEAFVAEMMRRYGGIPAEVLAEPDLMALLLPALRADMLALETYEPPAAAPLACPISAFGGSEDTRAPHAHLEAWRGETTADFRARAFTGGHFYLDARRDEVLAEVARVFEPVLAAPRAREANA